MSHTLFYSLCTIVNEQSIKKQEFKQKSLNY